MTKEKEILKKFRCGNVIANEKELGVLKDYASIGMVQMGFDGFNRKPEAALTKQGRWLLSRMR
ncbi:hypothetical protein KAR91_82760 [Candidatus Pacearchaeota archaeon]|nr:hypothetical protein [Candidatus Pacearchaeota archaeon]